MEHQVVMRRLNRALEKVDRIYADAAQQNGVTFNGLMVLYLFTEKKEITQKEISERLFLSKTTVHSLCVKFQEKGWIQSTVGRNAKEKNMHFTEMGQQFIATIQDKMDRIEQNVIDQFGEESILDLIVKAELLADMLKSEAEKIE